MTRTDTKTHSWFGLSRASWLTIPRLALQEMPDDWQERFYALLDEAYDVHGMGSPGETYVSRRNQRGQFMRDDPWDNYKYGTVAEASTEPGDSR